MSPPVNILNTAWAVRHQSTPLCVEEAPVLDGDGCVLQILRDLLILHPLGADGGEHLSQLLVLAAVIRIVHHTVFSQREVPQVQRGVGG